MKSKVFKIAVPAFAFMLAIVASFAFNPAHNGMEEDSMFITGYVQNGGPSSCLQVIEEGCALSGGPVCQTTNSQFVSGILIEAGTDVYKESTSCITQLKRP